MYSETNVKQKEFFAKIFAAIDFEPDKDPNNKSFEDIYNSTVDSILSDANLMREFNIILNEQKAILIIDGGVSEIDAEMFICQEPNIRRTVMFFIEY